jgi:hypothetical protein
MIAGSRGGVSIQSASLLTATIDIAFVKAATQTTRIVIYDDTLFLPGVDE